VHKPAMEPEIGVLNLMVDKDCVGSRFQVQQVVMSSVRKTSLVESIEYNARVQQLNTL
jgi:hypothetical protein